MPTLRGDLRRLDALLAGVEADFARAFIAAFSQVRKAANTRRAIAALERGQVEQAIAALNLRADLLYPIDQALSSAYAAGALSIGAGIPARAGVLGFDGRAVRAEMWARDHVGSYIQQVVASQVEMARDVIVNQLQAGKGPRAVITDLVGRVGPAGRQGGFIGLTKSQAGYVDGLIRPDGTLRRGMRQELEGLSNSYFNRKLRDRRFDAAVRKAIESGKPLPKELQERILGRYKDRLLAHRAETIARTESITALRAGREEGIQQAIDNGIIDPTKITKVWDATGDKRMREDHKIMHNKRVSGVNTPFVFPDGSLAQFPGDTSLGAPPEQVINCRCVVRYEIDYLS